MDHEYEAKFVNINETAIKKQLTMLGGRLIYDRRLFKRAIYQIDTHRWIRLRDEGDIITLTLKEVSDSKTIHGTKEVMVQVDDFDKTAVILEAGGLKRANFQENYREEWRLSDVVFDFDTWPDMPTFLEIEGSDHLAVEKAAAQVGLDYTQAKFGSVDRLYLDLYGRDITKESTLTFSIQADDQGLR